MIIDGRKIAKGILKNLKTEVLKLPFQPVFCDILVGSNEVSAQYVRMKAKTAEKIGLKFRQADFPANITTAELVAEIKKINDEPNLCGLIVQLPLPSGLDKKLVLDAIRTEIDVDCTGQINSDLFYQGQAFLEFPTAAAVMQIIDSCGVKLQDKNILVVGQGDLVGKPVTLLLKKRGLSVNTADKDTLNTPELIRQADVIVTAVGKANLIKGDMVKLGCIVVDAGTSESNLPAGQAGGGIVGDVELTSVSQVASFVSPVPGGVGPITVAMLMNNVIKVAQAKDSLAYVANK